MKKDEKLKTLTEEEMDIIAGGVVDINNTQLLEKLGISNEQISMCKNKTPGQVRISQFHKKGTAGIVCK